MIFVCWGADLLGGKRCGPVVRDDVEPSYGLANAQDHGEEIRQFPMVLDRQTLVESRGPA